MARRIGLAQALINDPDLLILDEPTTGLDPIGTRQIKDLIIELAKRGKTILLCSHLLADVEDVCNRVSILYGGKIQAQGEVSQLLRQSDKTEITMDLIAPATLGKIEQILTEERAKYTISTPMTKLETYFINIVAAAQQQELPTSGAQSKGHISDFLTSKTESQSAILDQLVSAKVQDAEQSRTDETQIIDSKPVPAANEDFLKELTQKVEMPQPRPVEQQSQQAQPLQEQTDAQNILDELTGRSESKTKKASDSPPKEGS
jgi:ABC-2 type transport system ATP-binding protein